ncbi:MAG: hypothetical protein KatS3mg076_1634 [Candidatus Binatia bacterium]|nr:MAG: hypothetical protein KatS3mg076_1634 [Candidatus Binatia bacterium]
MTTVVRSGRAAEAPGSGSWYRLPCSSSSGAAAERGFFPRRNSSRGPSGPLLFLFGPYGLGVLPFVFSLAFCPPLLAVVTIHSSTETVPPGGVATVAFRAEGGEDRAATYLGDIHFDVDNLSYEGCDVDARLAATHLGVFPAPGTRRVPLILGLVDTEPPVQAFGDGTLFSCRFRAGPVEGTFPLRTAFLEVGDTFGREMEARAVDGAIVVVLAVAPPTSTPSPPDGGEPTPPSPPARTPTPTAGAPEGGGTPTAEPTAGPGRGRGGGGCDCDVRSGGTPSLFWALLPGLVLALLRRRSFSAERPT